MKFTSLFLALILANLLPLAGQAAEPAAAGEAAPAGAADRVENERARAQELRRQAGAERQAADARYTTEQNACASKFLVNSCRDEAKKKHSAAMVASRKLDAEARAIEQQLRQQEADEREAKRQQEAPRREREAQQRAAQNKAEQEAAAARVLRKQAEKAGAGGAR